MLKTKVELRVGLNDLGCKNDEDIAIITSPSANIIVMWW